MPPRGIYVAMVTELPTPIGLLGGRGLLGLAIRAEFGDANIQRFDWQDILAASDSELQRIIHAANIRVIVNCAAHTDVEAAEIAPEIDRQSNTILPEKLARACASTDTTLVHFSSTGCYGNWQNTPYTETDLCQPTTTHHRHKFEGEKAVQDAGGKHLILRTGWLFGSMIPERPDFVVKRIQEASGVSQMTSDAKQFGNPTYTVDVARQTRHLIATGAEGLFNVVNTGHASRFEYIQEIVAISGLACKVEPGPAFSRKAKVSPNEMALNKRLEDTDASMMGGWKDALRRYIFDFNIQPRKI